MANAEEEPQSQEQRVCGEATSTVGGAGLPARPEGATSWGPSADQTPHSWEVSPEGRGMSVSPTHPTVYSSHSSYSSYKTSVRSCHSAAQNPQSHPTQTFRGLQDLPHPHPTCSLSELTSSPCSPHTMHSDLPHPAFGAFALLPLPQWLFCQRGSCLGRISSLSYSKLKPPHCTTPPHPPFLLHFPHSIDHSNAQQVLQFVCPQLECEIHTDRDCRGWSPVGLQSPGQCHSTGGAQ